MSRVNRTWDEIAVGEAGELTRVCTSDDIVVFVLASGNYSPAHLAPTPEAVAPSMWVGSLFSSVAVLVARSDGDDRTRELATVLRSVVQARETRYLMLNAPASALDEIARLVPGSGSPTVLPLAEPGMVAIHALVPAGDVWRLLPKLEAAGGSSILLVPVERMLP